MSLLNGCCAGLCPPTALYSGCHATAHWQLNSITAPLDATLPCDSASLRAGPTAGVCAVPRAPGCAGVLHGVPDQRWGLPGARAPGQRAAGRMAARGAHRRWAQRRFQARDWNVSNMHPCQSGLPACKHGFCDGRMVEAGHGLWSSTTGDRSAMRYTLCLPEYHP